MNKGVLLNDQTFLPKLLNLLSKLGTASISSKKELKDFNLIPAPVCF